MGSITHCRGYRACAVAKAGDVLSVGVDAEVHEPLPVGVLEQVAFGPELTMVSDGGPGGPVVNGVRLKELRGRCLVEDGIVASAATVLPSAFTVTGGSG